MVDRTCGSVLNVWKTVDRFSATGFTALIHGKYAHEETRATASRTTQYEDGRYLVVRDRDEASVVCDYIRQGGNRDAFIARFAAACSPGFDPDLHLQRVGLANQTTMLSTESLEIQDMFRRALIHRYGETDLEGRFRAFDTICSATQDRQDSVHALIAERPDPMIVIGGDNRSHTKHLAALAGRRFSPHHTPEPPSIPSSRA